MTVSNSTSDAVLATFVAGFNAHGQLCESHYEDLRSFEKRPEMLASKPESQTVFFAGWSSTILQGAGDARGFVSLGHGKIDATTGDVNVQLRCAVGDHNSLKACLDDQGYLYVAEIDSQLLKCWATEASPLLSHIALAQNGRVALTFKQAPNGRLCHVVEFASFDAFLRWYTKPSEENNRPERHHMIPGRPKQLLGTASFMLLMDNGEVYTWGDARHQSLGRAIAGENETPADQPGTVEALGGLKVTKIASGGWISAALSDAALYLWGNIPSGVVTVDFGEANLVHLPNTGSEPLDVLDVAVGDGHVIAVTEGGRVFVVGNNNHGQLGLASEQDFFSDWQELQRPGGVRIVGVAAGPKCTFAYVAMDTECRS